jgi:hypothetical protein
MTRNVVEARGEIVSTTVGRVLFYNIVPEELPFSSSTARCPRRRSVS